MRQVILMVLVGICASTSSCIDPANEEDGTQLGLNDVHDQVRNGVRLIISYDAACNTFIGSVENTTRSTINQVRVEVYLSNGIELGPTPHTDMVPGERRDVILQATSNLFATWSAHPEVG